ncbi:unnamed protein product [Pieris macdunnoughi]|uniref:Polypeptide N-acetylgalactosaminyltransferase n=1 Tax=Pieris macdunnoughi TaxID=345717 RepID=A0A821S7H8_9NEOP|nr:unnamed protein product [Pieris macdunnoughi]
MLTARLAGAKAASADVLLFLVSHTEANANWLPPLLEPIALDHRTVVCPYIDVIAYDTFEYRAQDEGARGAFDWELVYKRLPLLPKDVDNMPEPFESLVMAGGLFAMSRSFFWELGGYDPGLDIWGGEQYELSFKIWQRGGRMVDAPCSRVGHIYRVCPIPQPGAWRLCGMELPSRGRSLDGRKALRERLRCRSFRWFMTQVAFDLTVKYPPVEPNAFAEGRIKPVSNPQLCETKRLKQATIDGCLDWDPNTRALYIMPCGDATTQQWSIDHVDYEMMGKWDNVAKPVTGPVEDY